MTQLKLPAGRQIYRLLTLSLLLVFAIGLEDAFIEKTTVYAIESVS